MAPIPSTLTLSRTEKLVYIETILSRLYEKIQCVSTEQMSPKPSWFSTFAAIWIWRIHGSQTPWYIQPCCSFPRCLAPSTHHS